ncbi:MAG: hypothetical protein HY659_03460 [Rhizobiales bacterium]|nr:hypothetical protein [Hyphomicrobiales bacterium]
MLRLVIVIIAAVELLYLAANIPLELTLATLTDRDAHWFNVTSALAEAVIAPLLALAAIGLCIANRRLGLAVFFAALAPFVYLSPIIAFAIGIAIYGF